MYRLAFLTVALLACASGAATQTGPYIQVDLGASLGPPLTVHGSDNDWATRCDLILNPLEVEVGSGECDTAPPLSAWTNGFGGGAGTLAALALGYDLGRIRFELEYLHRDTTYDRIAGSNIADDVSLDKREQEIELATSAVGDFQSHALFVHAYYDVELASSGYPTSVPASAWRGPRSTTSRCGSATTTRRGLRRSRMRCCAPGSPVRPPSARRG